MTDRTAVERTATALERHVEETADRLATLDAAVGRRQPAPGKWSIAEILGHLHDSATNNLQRFVRAQETDLLTLPGYAQNHWVSVQGYNDAPWPELVELWRLANRHIARVIRRLPEHKLGMECRIGHYDPATLGFLVEDYLAHQIHHLQQVMALEGR